MVISNITTYLEGSAIEIKLASHVNSVTYYYHHQVSLYLSIQIGVMDKNLQKAKRIASHVSISNSSASLMEKPLESYYNLNMCSSKSDDVANFFFYLNAIQVVLWLETKG